MAKLNRFKALVFQDLTQLMSKKPFQNESIACFHNTMSPGRFWSFLEFSKRDGQYLNRTKENETLENNVNLPETLLAFPTRTQMFESSFSKTDNVKESSILNINLKNFKSNQHSELATEDVSLKTKVPETVNNSISTSVPESPEVLTKSNCSPISKSEKNPSKNNSSKVSQLNLDLENFESGPVLKETYKASPSRSLTRISLINKGNKFQSSSMKMEKSFSILNKEKGKSSTAFMLPVEATRLRRSNSFSDQIVSRYSSGVADSGRDISSSMSKPGLSKTSIQVANMSSGSGRKNNRNRKKSKKSNNNNNDDDDSQECQPPCPPSPPPPPCCPPPPPPPPPPCCPESPPPPPPKPSKCNKEKKSRKKTKKSSSDCQNPEPPCVEPVPEKETQAQKPKQNKCNGWCPDAQKGDCYQSKCPEKKKRPCPPQPKPCPPRCFEPDPCEKPKSICVGCPPKKKNPKDRNFSTWTSVGSILAFATRSFTSDPCGNKTRNEETVEERFNKRFPKPGPACKEAKDDNKCKPAASIKPSSTNDKCNNNNKPTPDKKTCQNSAVSAFAKKEAEMIEDLMRKEFEEVQKCKQGRKQSKKSETTVDKKYSVKTCETNNIADDEAKVPSGLKKVIDACNIEKIQKAANKIDDAKCGMTAVEYPIGSPYKTILASFQQQQIDAKISEKTKKYLSVTALKTISEDSNIVKKHGEDLKGNFGSKNVMKEMEPRNWLTSWLQ